MILFFIFFCILFRLLIAASPTARPLSCAAKMPSLESTNLLLILIIPTSFRNIFAACRCTFKRFPFRFRSSKVHTDTHTQSSQHRKLKWWVFLLSFSTRFVSSFFAHSKNLQNGIRFFSFPANVITKFATLITISCIIRLMGKKTWGKSGFENVSLRFSMQPTRRTHRGTWKIRWYKLHSSTDKICAINEL